MSGAFFIGTAIMLVLALSVNIRSAARTRASFDRNCQQTWRTLREQLSGRHLIISHLVDSVAGEKRLSSHAEMLAKALSEVDSLIQQIGEALPTSGEAYSIGESESECLRQLRLLCEELANAPEIQSQRSVSACLNGLDRGDEEIDNSKTTYNAAVITYNTHLDSRTGRWLTLLGQPASHYGTISFDWFGSDSGLVRPSPNPNP